MTQISETLRAAEEFRNLQEEIGKAAVHLAVLVRLLTADEYIEFIARERLDAEECGQRSLFSHRYTGV